MMLTEISGGLLAGGIGGLASGFLGITSGGILVPLLVLLLGADQHVAQGISLMAQVVPTSLSGVRQYRRSGHSVAMRWLVWLGLGFAGGGCIGALLAIVASERTLQWTFVGYLLILLALMGLRYRNQASNDVGRGPEQSGLNRVALIAVGMVAGWSSGFLGIGGGLAITALMVAGLKVDQHRAQAVSLAVTALPVTLPAALLYVQQGTPMPWWTIAGLVVGLWIGTGVGARFANRMSPHRLRHVLMTVIAAMATFMAFKAAS
jgi:uncharacterized membrane protein YfcA